MEFPGVIGRLPAPAWRDALKWLSSLDEERVDVALTLRRVCKALMRLVAEHNLGELRTIAVKSAEEAVEFEAASTESFGLAICVEVALCAGADAQRVLVEALATAVRRGHHIGFQAPEDACEADVARPAEAALVEAARTKQLLFADFREGEQLGWSVEALAQLNVVTLDRPSFATMKRISEAGVLTRIELSYPMWADVSILSGLNDIELYHAEAVEDLTPLIHVRRLRVWECGNIKTLPPMQNKHLHLTHLTGLRDLSGLAGGSVEHIELCFLFQIWDLSPIAMMKPQPSVVVLNGLRLVEDVSMLAETDEINIFKCVSLSREATEAAFKDKDVTVHWLEEMPHD